tara:strand:+ start:451 stop:633 length:183 start_codon:yes stop_codon:yes gene_type:complete
MEDKEFYVTAGKGLKLSGLLCVILSFIFFIFNYKINQIDFVELFLMGCLVFVCGSLLQDN